MTPVATTKSTVSDWLAVDAAAPERFEAAPAYQAGIRAIEVSHPVNLAEPTWTDLRALDVVRISTAEGLHVSWRLRALPPGFDPRSLSHLYPPSQIDQPLGTDDIEAWWEGFYLARCCWRQGPGFVQVRDRRSGSLERYTITEPDLTQILYALDAGGLTADLGQAQPMIEEGLVLTFGAFAWLAPYRLVRWPTPSMGV